MQLTLTVNRQAGRVKPQDLTRLLGGEKESDSEDCRRERLHSIERQNGRGPVQDSVHGRKKEKEIMVTYEAPFMAMVDLYSHGCSERPTEDALLYYPFQVNAFFSFSP